MRFHLRGLLFSRHPRFLDHDFARGRTARALADPKEKRPSGRFVSYPALRGRSGPGMRVNLTEAI
jgi:hypothetical protein